MASSKLKKRIDSINNDIGGNLILKEKRKINNPFIKEGGDNNQVIILKSVSNLSSSSSLLSSSSHTLLPIHSTISVGFSVNTYSSISAPISSFISNNYSNPACDNTSEFVDSTIIFDNSSSSVAAKSYCATIDSSFSATENSSSSYPSSTSTQFISSSLPEELPSSIPEDSSTTAKSSSSAKSSPPDNSSSNLLPSSSPSSIVTFVPRRRPRHVSGIGGGRVRILEVHSEPGSFALEESPIEEDELLIFRKIKGEKEEKWQKDLLEQQQTNNRRTNYLKDQRQHSAMSSLYRQV